MKLIIIIIEETDNFLIKMNDLFNKLNIDYYYLPKNTNHIDVIKFIKNKIYDYVFITYSNSFMNVNNLISFLEKQNDTGPVYIGGHGDFRNIANVKFYFHSHTPGICINKRGIEIMSQTGIYDNYNLLCKNNNSDLINNSGVAIGFFASIYNFKIINCENIWYCNCWGHPCHSSKPNLNTLVSCSNLSSSDFDFCYSLLDANKSNIIIHPSGGLGNLLFQFFYGYTISKEVDSNLMFFINTKYWRGDMNKHNIFSSCLFLNESLIDTNKYTRLNEQNSYYDPLDIKPNTNYIVYGYFQSYKYFISHISEIKKILFNNIIKKYEEIKNDFKVKYANKDNNTNNIKDTNICLIHIRRGDYLNYPRIHPVCSEEYYKNAIDFIHTPSTKYLIFSDDINWVKEWINRSCIKNYNYEIITETNPVNTLIMMTLCNQFIIANSSLSLCSYFLREYNDSTLIAPKNWFGPDAPKYKIEDILPEEAILF